MYGDLLWDLMAFEYIESMEIQIHERYEPAVLLLYLVGLHIRDRIEGIAGCD